MSRKSKPARASSPWHDPFDHRWGIILAGGDGKRLLPLTRKIAGDDRPKQFCAIMNGDTLLDQTRRRVRRMIKPTQTLLVVTKTHERFYADQLAGTPSSCLLVQPHNRGTAPAILFSLLRLLQLDPQAIVALFPSDHHFTDDDALIAHVDLAFEVAKFFSDRVVLLGIAPSIPEVEYGWIEPGPPLTNHASGRVFQVRRFWEKPSLALASVLLERGCLWNSFVMVGRADGFLNLIRRTLPSLFEPFESIRPSLLTAEEPAALLELYSAIRARSFSSDVLAAHPSDLAVLSCENLGWSDLGEISRVLSVFERKGVSPDWAIACTEQRKATA